MRPLSPPTSPIFHFFTMPPVTSQTGRPSRQAKSTPPNVSEADTFLSTLTFLHAAEFPIYNAVAEDSGLLKDLAAAWDEETADKILSVAFHWMHTRDNEARLFASWVEGKLLPAFEPMDCREMTEFFRYLAEQPDWRETFFRSRLARMSDEELLSYNCSRIAAQALALPHPQRGAGHQNEPALTLLVGRHTGMPAGFMLLPGRLADTDMVAGMLGRFGDPVFEQRKVFAAVLNRSHFSLMNFARFVDDEMPVIVDAPVDAPWIQRALAEASTSLARAESYLRGDLFGVTIPVKPRFDDGVERELWLHVYRSAGLASMETQAFFTELSNFQRQWRDWSENACKGRSSPLLSCRLLSYFQPPVEHPGKCELEINPETINPYLRRFGLFCRVSTMPSTAAEVSMDFGRMELMERVFTGGRSDDMNDIAQSHSDEALEGRFLVAFVALTILTDLRRRMSRKTVNRTLGVEKIEQPLGKEMNLEELRNTFNCVHLIVDGRGNRLWQGVTYRHHDIVRRLGFPDLYRKLPEWGLR